MAAFGAGVDVTLTPSSGPVAWGGACTAQARCVVPMNPCEIGHGLDRRRPLSRVSARREQDREGIDRRQPAGNPCGDDVRRAVAHRRAETLRAIPEAGWIFAGWSGSLSRASRATCDVVARAAASVSSPPSWRPGTLFPVAVSKVGQGTVTSKPAGHHCGRTCSRGFPAGSTVTIEAAAEEQEMDVRALGRRMQGTQDDMRDPARRREVRRCTFGRVADPTHLT